MTIKVLVLSKFCSHIEEICDLYFIFTNCMHFSTNSFKVSYKNVARQICIYSINKKKLDMNSPNSEYFSCALSDSNMKVKIRWERECYQCYLCYTILGVDAGWLMAWCWLTTSSKRKGSKLMLECKRWQTKEKG